MKLVNIILAFGCLNLIRARQIFDKFNGSYWEDLRKFQEVISYSENDESQYFEDYPYYGAAIETGDIRDRTLIIENEVDAQQELLEIYLTMLEELKSDKEMSQSSKFKLEK